MNFRWILYSLDKCNKIITRKKIRHINYSCNSPSLYTESNELARSPLIPSSPSTNFQITLKPSSFQDPSPSPLHINDQWFVDLSSTQIPTEVQGLLQLGENFCLPTNNEQKIVTEFIKCVDHNTNGLPSHLRLTVRNRVTPILYNLSNYSFKYTSLDRQLINASLTTRKFISDHPDIIFTRADKGNATVALNKNDYLKKMTSLLDDTTTYNIVHKDPIKKLIKNLHELLMRWKKREYITDKEYKNMNCTDGVLPRAYGVPKTKRAAPSE